VEACALLVSGALLTGVAFWAFHRVGYDFRWEGVWAYRRKFLIGWRVTLGLSLASLGVSLCFGLAAALAHRSRVHLARAMARIYVELVRGTPLLVQILLLFYIFGTAVGLQNRYVAGILILSLFAGAYISEILRAGIDSVAGTQLESARAIGLTSWQTYRLVILPQALRQVLPPLAGQFVSLIKDSSLLSVIAVNELTLNAREVNSFTFSTLESYLPLTALYLSLTLPLSLWIRRLENRMAYAT